MAQLSGAMVRLGALCLLAAVSDVCLSGARLRSGVRLISGLLAVEAILSLVGSLVSLIPGGWFV